MDATQGLGSASRRIAATLVEMAGTRLEPGATEIAEERLRLAQQLLAATLALFFLGVGLVLAVIGLAWWAGPADGARVLGAAAVIAAVLAALAVAWWRRIVRQRPPLLHETLTQLRADAKALKTFAP